MLHQQPLPHPLRRQPLLLHPHLPLLPRPLPPHLVLHLPLRQLRKMQPCPKLQLQVRRGRTTVQSNVPG